MRHFLITAARAAAVLAGVVAVSLALACGDDVNTTPTPSRRTCVGAQDPTCVTLTPSPTQSNVCTSPGTQGCLVTPTPPHPCAGPSGGPGCVLTPTPSKLCSGPTGGQGCLMTPAVTGDEAVAAAKADLASRLGVREDGISVQSVEAVDWPDSCLGVQTAGIACAQVITPGFKVVLDAGGKSYEYHSDSGSRVALVE